MEASSLTEPGGHWSSRTNWPASPPGSELLSLPPPALELWAHAITPDFLHRTGDLKKVLDACVNRYFTN